MNEWLKHIDRYNKEETKLYLYFNSHNSLHIEKFQSENDKWWSDSQYGYDILDLTESEFEFFLDREILRMLKGKNVSCGKAGEKHMLSCRKDYAWRRRQESS